MTEEHVPPESPMSSPFVADWMWWKIYGAHFSVSLNRNLHKPSEGNLGGNETSFFWSSAILLCSQARPKHSFFQNRPSLLRECNISTQTQVCQYKQWSLPTLFMSFYKSNRRGQGYGNNELHHRIWSSSRKYIGKSKPMGKASHNQSEVKPSKFTYSD